MFDTLCLGLCVVGTCVLTRLCWLWHNLQQHCQSLVCIAHGLPNTVLTRVWHGCGWCCMCLLVCSHYLPGQRCCHVHLLLACLLLCCHLPSMRHPCNRRRLHVRCSEVWRFGAKVPCAVWQVQSGFGVFGRQCQACAWLEQPVWPDQGHSVDISV
jgi:hypothetical protein